jgi:hypothetical protein
MVLASFMKRASGGTKVVRRPVRDAAIRGFNTAAGADM